VSKATSVSAVPTIIRGMFDLAVEQSTPILATLEALFCFGAPLFPEEKLKAKKLLCANFRDQYGSGICGRISAIWGSDLEQRPDSVGRPLPLVLLQIVDDNDEVLPVGEPGVIRLRSPGVSSIVYGENSRASGDSFRNGWAYPGDVGALDAEGFLRLLGRTSDRIIRGGINIQPAEVQAAIAKCPGVEDVFVMGSAQGREDEEVVAFIVSDGVKEEDLVAHCRVWLSPDKRPRRFVFVSELPRTAKGEVSRAKLSQHLSTV
jgi:acyl-CoA synthetase (AMP-forming)/AMP-acid ligase II